MTKQPKGERMWMCFFRDESGRGWWSMPWTASVDRRTSIARWQDSYDDESWTSERVAGRVKCARVTVTEGWR